MRWRRSASPTCRCRPPPSGSGGRTEPQGAADDGSCPFLWVLASVSSPNPQRSLRLSGGDGSKCPKADLRIGSPVNSSLPNPVLQLPGSGQGGSTKQLSVRARGVRPWISGVGSEVLASDSTRRSDPAQIL